MSNVQNPNNQFWDRLFNAGKGGPTLAVSFPFWAEANVRETSANRDGHDQWKVACRTNGQEAQQGNFWIDATLKSTLENMVGASGYAGPDRNTLYTISYSAAEPVGWAVVDQGPVVAGVDTAPRDAPPAPLSPSPVMTSSPASPVTPNGAVNPPAAGPLRQSTDYRPTNLIEAIQQQLQAYKLTAHMLTEGEIELAPEVIQDLATSACIEVNRQGRPWKADDMQQQAATLVADKVDGDILPPEPPAMGPVPVGDHPFTEPTSPMPVSRREAEPPAVVDDSQSEQDELPF